MKIRPLRKSEVVAASKIVGKNYSKQYERASRKDFQSMFKKSVNVPQYRVIQARKGIAAVAGYIQAWMDYHMYEIFWVNVAPEYQQKGMGTALVSHVLKEIKKIRGRDKYACVVLLTTKRPGFYKKFNFKTLMRFNKKKQHFMALSLE